MNKRLDALEQAHLRLFQLASLLEKESDQGCCIDAYLLSISRRKAGCTLLPTLLRFIRVLTCPKSPREGVECLASPRAFPLRLVALCLGATIAPKERSYLVLAEEMAAGNRDVYLFRMHYSRHISWFDVLLQVVVLAWNLRRKVCGANCMKPKLQDEEESPPTYISTTRRYGWRWRVVGGDVSRLPLQCTGLTPIRMGSLWLEKKGCACMYGDMTRSINLLARQDTGHNSFQTSQLCSQSLHGL